MTRPRKATVDYFPHSCRHGKTMFVLEEQYGIQGYYFWFRLLELLGTTEGHVIYCENPATWRFLTSKTRTTTHDAEEILQCLADMEAIDPELWQEKIIWSQNFVDGVKDAYRNRAIEIPKREDILRKKPVNKGVLNVIEPEISANEMKLDETRLDEMKYTCSPSGESVQKKSNGFESFWTAYPKKKGKGAAEKAFNSAKKQSEFNLIAVIQAIEHQKKSPEWTKENGQFIPFPATWLNQKRWLDEIKTEMDPWKELR